MFVHAGLEVEVVTEEEALVGGKHGIHVGTRPHHVARIGLADLAVQRLGAWHVSLHHEERAPIVQRYPVVGVRDQHRLVDLLRAPEVPVLLLVDESAHGHGGEVSLPVAVGVLLVARRVLPVAARQVVQGQPFEHSLEEHQGLWLVPHREQHPPEGKLGAARPRLDHERRQEVVPRRCFFVFEFQQASQGRQSLVVEGVEIDRQL
mmetsp:Transcript_16690/g.42189  ORF Transcript_16690/g.42189 Transcript_16690/m.42189 type:complete len:205 (+) Transcript_16690:96-710(+)